MSDDPQPGHFASKLVSELLGFIPKDIREMLGGIVGIYLMMLAPLLIIGGVIGAVKATLALSQPDKACWTIQKIDSRLIKLNTCTGETLELPPAQTPKKP